MLPLSYNKKEETYLKINKTLLQRYKSECDIYLVNIRSNLTRCLVDYHLFQELNDINGRTFKILSYLNDELYVDINEIKEDKRLLHNQLDVFNKHCKGNVMRDAYEQIFENSKKLLLVFQKLVEIVIVVNREEK